MDRFWDAVSVTLAIGAAVGIGIQTWIFVSLLIEAS